MVGPSWFIIRLAYYYIDYFPLQCWFENCFSSQTMFTLHPRHPLTQSAPSLFLVINNLAPICPAAAATTTLLLHLVKEPLPPASVHIEQHMGSKLLARAGVPLEKHLKLAGRKQTEETCHMGGTWLLLTGS